MLRHVFVLVALALMIPTASQAQPDSTKALVGEWEGEIGTRGRDADTNRTLVIESVTERDGKVIAAGRYGITGKGLGRVQIDVDTSGPRPSIQFTTGANSTVRLNLLDEKSLAGTIILPGSSQRGSDRTMKLEKTTP